MLYGVSWIYLTFPLLLFYHPLLFTPGLPQGKPICHGRGAKICDDKGKCKVDPDEGCRYDTKREASYCKCREPYFGGDCSSTFPGLVSCKWASNAVCGLDAAKHKLLIDHAKKNPHDAAVLESMKKACKDSPAEEECANKKVCSGNGKGSETTGECDCDKGWFSDIHGTCTVKCPFHDGKSCGGNGLCKKEGDLTHCECEEGYAGDSCEFQCPRGGSKNKVCSGYGVCHLGADLQSPSCHCHGGFKGEACNEMNDGTSPYL